MSKKHISVIAKPRHDCNLSCKYCYLEEEAEKGIMSDKILSESIKKSLNSQKVLIGFGMEGNRY